MREIEGAISSLVANASFLGRKITTSLAKEILKVYVKLYQKEITIDHIIEVVCNYLNLDFARFNSTERTREIGIRKAIGASRGVILQQFLLESVVLCMLGCAIGIFLSWGTLRIISVVVASLDMTFRMNGAVVLIAVLFCFIIGVGFGLYPANKAAKMKPIDALHYGG